MRTVSSRADMNCLASCEGLRSAIDRLHEAGIAVSLFIDPDPRQIEAAAAVQADSVELHTGPYANAAGRARGEQLQVFHRACEVVVRCGLNLHAGHGLTYSNVRPIAEIPDVQELNIGHSIVSRAVMVGMTQAVREMKALVAGNLAADR